MHSGRAFERLITFTDAVVAVAITLLILPIIDIRGDSQEDSVWAIIGDHSSEIITFAFTFIVVAIMWRAHNRVMNSLKGYDEFIFWMNLIWLMAVVFLPWTSALYGEGIGVAAQVNNTLDTGGSGTLYWLTLAVISASGAAIVWHANRKPDLREEGESSVSRAGVRRGVIFTVSFIVLAMLSLILPLLASWLPLALIPVSIVSNRRVEQKFEKEEINRGSS